MDFYSVIMDFFWVSVILCVAKIIREHVKILQNFFIPVSLIAGFIAWVVGPYGLKIVPLTSLCGDYAGALITVLFATIGLQGLGIKKGEGKKRAKDIAGYCLSPDQLGCTVFRSHDPFHTPSLPSAYRR